MILDLFYRISFYIENIFDVKKKKKKRLSTREL